MKKIVSIVMALAMVLGMSAMAFAAPIATSGGSGAVPVTLSSTAATFSVTLPTALPVTLAADGTVTVADNCVITNNSSGSIKITSITVAGNADPAWTKVAFSSVDTFKGYQVDSNQFALKLGATAGAMQDSYSELTAAGGIISTSISGTSGSNTLPVIYDALVSGTSTSLSNQTIANVTFVATWDD